MINVLIFFLVIFIIGESEKDLIEHEPKKCFFPKWKWYIENRWQTHSWWLKNVFTMFLDGWHFWKAVTVAIPLTYFAVLFGLAWYWVIILYAIAGLYHSLRAGSVFRKGLNV